MKYSILPSFLHQRILAVLVALSLAASVRAQMVHPSIDREDEPFSYFSKPTDVLGVMDGKEGTLVTPEGYLCTGFGEFMLFTGSPPQPVNQRVKTLLSGYLPVVEYQFVREEIRYRVQMVAATLDSDPESPLMNFVRVSIGNMAEESRTAFLTAATRYQNEANTDWGIGDNRFLRPQAASVPGQYEQAGTLFDPGWEYAFGDDMFLRDGRVMYLFPREPSPAQTIVLHTGYNEPHEVGSMRIPILPTTPVGVTAYKVRLKPGEERQLVFKIPYEPVGPSDPNVAKLRMADFDDVVRKTRETWDALFAGGIDVTVPEEKVNQTFKANLVYDLIARNKHGEWYIQKVNEFQYDSFWIRDAAFIVRMYDLSGYHDLARQCLKFFPQWQQADGNFLSQGGQFDGWGQALWAFGQHARLTGDSAFARAFFPYVRKAFAWLVDARRQDPLHLIPVTTPGDNENITGHVTGHNFWALAGLENAMIMALLAGQSEDFRRFAVEYRDFRSTLLDRLKIVTARTGGYIPPGLDTLGGSDWGNMMAVYPHMTLGPHDSMVTATLNATRNKYSEGIMTYDEGRYLHHYLTMKNTETLVIRGDQQLALEEFYALLVHTSSTHAGFEFSIRPWGTRDFGMNLSPHGWFSAKFRTLLRNMMVREEENSLHLLSAVSPAWFGAGGVITVRNAPTTYGDVNFTVVTKKGRTTMTVNAEYRHKPEQVVVHIPWFLKPQSVIVDGKKVAPGRSIVVPPGSRLIEITWDNGSLPNLSFERAVGDFKKEFRRRYDRFLRDGGDAQ